MDNLIFKAMKFAHEKHADQRRKYTGNCYIEHPAEVVAIVASAIVFDNHEDFVVTMCAAWMHDLIEDQGVTYDYLRQEYGEKIAVAVQRLSNTETGNRQERKAAARLRISSSNWIVQNIKVGDIISNARSIKLFAPTDFAHLYLAESRAMLAGLNLANKELLSYAKMVVE